MSRSGRGRNRGRNAVIVLAVVFDLGVAHGAADGGWVQAAVNGAGVLLGGGLVWLGLRSLERGERAPGGPRAR